MGALKMLPLCNNYVTEKFSDEVLIKIAYYIPLKNSKYYLRVTYLRVIFRNFVPNY